LPTAEARQQQAPEKSVQLTPMPHQNAPDDLRIQNHCKNKMVKASAVGQRRNSGV